ncbi:Uncharacterized protein Fot_24546 [Forsythia ovata]|uniref:Uncharacterized protein n=1 Tax=Forsythia ovata TaxID=205694 RepID=A0ABD1U7L1_9LAMI
MANSFQIYNVESHLQLNSDELQISTGESLANSKDKVYPSIKPKDTAAATTTKPAATKTHDIDLFTAARTAGEIWDYNKPSRSCALDNIYSLTVSISYFNSPDLHTI